VSLDLEYGPGAVRTARHFVRDALSESAVKRFADDAELVVAELVTNAVLHAAPPLRVTVRASASGVRIDVADGAERPPVRPTANPEAMTGRGLALVAALSSQWGFETAGAGKVVWTELGETGDDDGTDVDIDTLIETWADDVNPAGIQTYSVSLGDVPTDLLLAAKAHVDNLIREFVLATTGAATGETTAVPAHLAELIEVVVNRFAEARQAIKRQALAAAARGDERTFLSMTLPLSAADAGRDYLRALDGVEGYARAARLLTLESPPQHRAFRRWYVNGLIDQLTAQRVSDRAARLQQVTAALAGATTPEEVAAIVVSEGVAALEAAGGSLLVPADDSHIGVPGAVGYAEEIVEQLRSEGRDADLPAAQVLRTGRPVWLETRQERDEQFPTLEGFEPRTAAMCAVPMLVGTNTVGALRFSFDRPRLFDEDERRFVLALAAQAALALERALLFAAERSAVERSTFLAEATQRLASSLEPDQTIATLTSLLVPEFAEWAVVYLRNDDGRTQPVAFRHSDPTMTLRHRETFLTRSPGLAEAAGVADVLSSGRSTRHESIPPQLRDTALRASADNAAVLAALAPSTSMCVPLSLRGEVIGAVGLARTSGPAYEEKDLQIVEDLVLRAAVAVSNARSYQRERQTALTLQRSLLPQRLPVIPGVSFAWRYLPAGASASIGGDWYDVLRLDDDRVALVIGDVMGRGITAAAVMGQLRATARAYASAQLTPADVLSHMDGAVTRLEQAQITTAAVAILDVPAHTLTIASAGHLPPLLLHPTEGAGYISVEPGPPLGAATPDYPQTTVSLPSGSMLLLFTDGLVEDRHRPVDVGMEELQKAAMDATDPEDLCDRALGSIGHEDRDEDDTAMLAFVLNA
jgi:GAF domain-containing protein/anti-sigma regulatory factor (Ser/Thr protein kinase)